MKNLIPTNLPPSDENMKLIRIDGSLEDVRRQILTVRGILHLSENAFENLSDQDVALSEEDCNALSALSENAVNILDEANELLNQDRESLQLLIHQKLTEKKR